MWKEILRFYKAFRTNLTIPISPQSQRLFRKLFHLVLRCYNFPTWIIKCVNHSTSRHDTSYVSTIRYRVSTDAGSWPERDKFAPLGSIFELELKHCRKFTIYFVTGIVRLATLCCPRLGYVCLTKNKYNFDNIFLKIISHVTYKNGRTKKSFLKNNLWICRLNFLTSHVGQLLKNSYPVRFFGHTKRRWHLNEWLLTDMALKWYIYITWMSIVRKLLYREGHKIRS